ncbi:hypothetical protein HDU81_011078 [Chytriomyces hyalinus]|nr:hypothetical protein HDU81_011069 [Chytriomyces hyalinus]KAJ3236235.1 hypothetical protein HDU81_011078 [Chytriomyces hyalinus]
MQSLTILAFALAAAAQVIPTLPSTADGVAQYFSKIVPNKPDCGTSCFTDVPGATLPATVASATAFCAAYSSTFSACVARKCPASAKPDWDSLITVLPNLCQTVSGNKASSSAAATSASDAAPTGDAAATTTAAGDSAAPADPTTGAATDASRSSVSAASVAPATGTATRAATSAAAQKTVSATSLAAPTSIKSSADTVSMASFVLGAVALLL